MKTNFVVNGNSRQPNRKRHYDALRTEIDMWLTPNFRFRRIRIRFSGTILYEHKGNFQISISVYLNDSVYIYVYFWVYWFYIDIYPRYDMLS